MAFGIRRDELKKWKQTMERGEIAFLTHYWLDDRFPHSKTVTKVGCCNVKKLIEWGKQYGLQPEWIDMRNPSRPHFDLLGEKQKLVLKKEGLLRHIQRFNLD